MWALVFTSCVTLSKFLDLSEIRKTVAIHTSQDGVSKMEHLHRLGTYLAHGRGSRHTSGCFYNKLQPLCLHVGGPSLRLTDRGLLLKAGLQRGPGG